MTYIFKKSRIFNNSRLRGIFVVSIILLFFITIGFARLNNKLVFDGLTTLSGAKWDVHFDNLVLDSSNVVASIPASISDKTKIEYEVSLANPGDKYEFSVDVVNAGNIDAKISDIDIRPILSSAEEKYLEYSVKYFNGNDIKVGDKLKAGESVKLQVIFKYRDNITYEDIPIDENQVISKVQLIYSQDK